MAGSGSPPTARAKRDCRRGVAAGPTCFTTPDRLRAPPTVPIELTPRTRTGDLLLTRQLLYPLSYVIVKSSFSK